jgi:adenylate kinase
MIVTSDRYATVILFGAPGVGKGTQGKILAQVPGFYHMSTGDMFRTLDTHTGIGQQIMDYMSRGELVPDELTIKLWRENTHARSVLSQYKPHEDILILDGLPRNVNQAQMLKFDLNVLAVIHLVCSDQDEMVKRLRRRALKENRRDDAKEDVIRHRWSIYEEETRPVLAQYEKEIIHEVDAMGSPASVLQHTLEELVPVQNAHFNRLPGD